MATQAAVSRRRKSLRADADAPGDPAPFVDTNGLSAAVAVHAEARALPALVRPSPHQPHDPTAAC
ncbi:MAG: hypothetical protein Q8O61_01245 [Nocardioides sp.]|nr:hypothetical protein [Nocardioides sp.]